MVTPLDGQTTTLRGRRRLASLFVAGLLIGLLVWFVWLLQMRPEQRPEHAAGGDTLPADVVQQLSTASQRLAAQARPGVVRIDARSLAPDSRDTKELAQLFGAAPPSRGQGSGVIVTADGYILTNYHVVRGARTIEVVRERQRRFTARLVGSDILTDLAVLKIDVDNLPAVPWGDSDLLEVGALVWAIGSPFGLEGSVSLGIISAKNRGDLGGSPYQEFLQTDAAINPGNSGGPLINDRGQLVGINTAILGDRFQGIGFAIPGNLAREVFQQLVETGTVARGWIGVVLEPLTAQRAAQLNVDQPGGAYVVAVASQGNADSPAGRAGLQPGDLITHWHTQPVQHPTELTRLVTRAGIGTETTVTVVREGRSLKLPIVVGRRPD
tara:strand:+ start:3995 stop:5140 length:1146 start_codon:yes stop_codon:yes gene_type:complete